MLRQLKQIVSSFIIVSSFAICSYANKIPLTQEAQLTVPVGQFSVVEFPFLIKGKNITSFMLAKKNKKHKKEPLMSEIEKKIGSSKKKQKKQKSLKKSKYLIIKQNANGFTFFPKREGTVKMVVWGYDYPILLTITASKTNGYGLYQFEIPISQSKEVTKTEQGSHESIINKLMVHLFNQTLPKGYKSASKDISYTSNGFRLRLNREIDGRRYKGEEWILTNISNPQSTINEESFYQKNVFGVSLEDNKIKKGENIRVFIVRGVAKPRGKKYE